MSQGLPGVTNRSGNGVRGNQSRVEYAKLSIEEMAMNAIRNRRSGTIGVEISIKDGKLGKVKQFQVVFQRE
jgi:hypothetical protein